MVKQLSASDEALLEHVARYRLTLPEIVAGSGLLPDPNSQAAVAALETLASAGWLAKTPLSPGHSQEPYYHLTAQSARRLGHDADFAKPLPRDLRIDAYAIAKFCCGGEPFRQLLTKQEFQEQFRALWFPGQPVRYYLERGEGGAARLAFLKVDRDGAGRWDRLIDSCARFLRQRTDVEKVALQHRPQVEAFAQLVRRGQFQFTVLTALEDKQRAIELELERRNAADEPAPPMQVYVVSGLFALLFPEIAAPAKDRDSIR